MDPPPAARRSASKRRERRRRRAAAAAATGAASDMLAAGRGSTEQGNAAAAASSSRRRGGRRRRRRDRAAKAAAAAEAFKSPEAPVSVALRGKCTGAQGDLHDTANCVSDVASVHGDSSLQSSCCFEAVEAHLSVRLPQTTTKKIVKSNKIRKRNLQQRNKTTKVCSEDGAEFFKESDKTCHRDGCTALGNADASMDYQNEDSKCPVMKKTSLSENSEETSLDCSSLQELEKHVENENGASIDPSNLKEETKKRKGRKRRNRCKKTTSLDCPLSNGADDPGLVRMVSEKNTSCLRPMANSVSVDKANTEGEIVNLDSAIDKRCELGNSNLDCTSTERNELLEQDAACSEDSNANCLSTSSLAEASVEKLKIVLSPTQSVIGFPKKKLLILDLNGLLADINQDYHNAHMADAKVRGKLVFRRPYCDDFLKFCSWNFDLGVWSSRKKQNVASVVNIVMRDFRPHLLFCWDMSKCTFTGCKTLENMHKPLVLKELRKLWNKEEPDLPWEEGDYSPSNTLLVDDSPYKALRNPPHTAIFPRPYSYLNQTDNSLGPGGDLRMYLQNLAAADDVESYVRNNPFGQPFITESDPHWNFYAQIADKRSVVADKVAAPLACCA